MQMMKTKINKYHWESYLSTKLEKKEGAKDLM